MKTTVLVWLVALLPVIGGATAADLKIVVNSGTAAGEISLDDLRDIFLGVKTSLKSMGHLQPVLVKAPLTRAILASQYLGKTEEGLETYYRSLVFSGRWSMPRSLNSDADAVAYVARTPGAIACVQMDVPTAGAKTLRLTR